jgi:phosphatidylserine decarboxylase
MMKIHREGYKILIGLALLLIAFNFALYHFFSDNLLVMRIFGVLSIGFFLAVASFFRSPRRFTVQHDKRVIAPADGKVVVIEETEEHEYFQDKRIQVSIFMSPANVHVNRNPISGVVTYSKYHKGLYLVAWHPKSSTANERNTIVIENDDHEVLLRQIAGKVARKIVSYVDVGDEVEQGQEFGFIKFGSRVDLFFPLGTKILAQIGDKVKGGVTVIAEFE